MHHRVACSIICYYTSIKFFELELKGFSHLMRLRVFHTFLTYIWYATRDILWHKIILQMLETFYVGDNVLTLVTDLIHWLNLSRHNEGKTFPEKPPSYRYGVYAIIKLKVCERDLSREWICCILYARKPYYKALDFCSKIWSCVRKPYYKTPQ